MENVKLIESFKRYEQAITNCQNAELPTVFFKMYKYMTDKMNSQVAEESEIYNEIRLAAIYIACKEAKKRELNLKLISSNWDSFAIQRFYKIRERINTVRKEYLQGIASLDDYKSAFAGLLANLRKQSDPCVLLYQYMCHYDSFDGRNLYESSYETVNKMIKNIKGE